MGDRGNIAVQDRGKRVWFYTHWSGSIIPAVVARSLARSKDRWDDPPYLARVIFADLTEGHERGTQGFGISAEPGDNEYAFLIVDCDTQTVYAQLDTSRSWSRKDDPLAAITFSDFQAMATVDSSAPQWDVLVKRGE